jgi:hypothetical protein
MTNEERRLADMEAAIESKEARARALQREKDEQILRVIDKLRCNGILLGTKLARNNINK